MNWGFIGQFAYQMAYKVFSAWIAKTQPVDAIKELIAEIDIVDVLTNTEKREFVYQRAEEIFDREWGETKGFIKDFAFSVAYQEFKTEKETAEKVA